MEAVPMADRELRATTAAAIDATCAVAAQSIVTEIYRNPFWQARYGDSGRARSIDDVERNLAHLSASLRLDLPTEVVRHYRWLRELLVMRGMCTQQLRDGLEMTATVLNAALTAQQSAITNDWLMQAHRSLGYDSDFGQASAAAEHEIIAGALERLSAEGADYAALRYLLSYFTDALCTDRPDLFTAYVVWLTLFSHEAGVIASVLRGQIEALGVELEQRLPDFAAQTQPLIKDALGAISGAEIK